MSAPGLQGLRPWMIQRISAVYIALFCVYLLTVIYTQDLTTFDNYLSWVSSPLNNIALGLFLITVLWHAWIGIRDIILDYVGNILVRVLMQTLVILTLIGSGLWGLKSLFQVVII
jgi:succinate dehydrogenase / fumarate reductase membrane anchor subunit